MSDTTIYSGMNGSGGGDKLRILGMASGLDVDATVKKMMAGEQTKVDKVKQEKQIAEWKQEIYQEVIADIKTLQNKYFNSLNKENFLMSSETLSSFNATIMGDQTAISISAGIGSKMGTYKVEFGNDGKLASEAIVEGETLGVTTKTFNSDNWKGKDITFSINGKDDQTISLENPIPNGQNIEDVVDEINNKISGNDELKSKVQARVKDGHIQFEALSNSSVKIVDSTVDLELDELKGIIINPGINTKMEDLGLTADKQEFKFSYNGKEANINIEKTDTIESVINKISEVTKNEVVAEYSQLTKKFTIRTKDTGSNQSIKIETPFEYLGLKDTTEKVGENTVVNITPPGSTEAVKVTKSTRNFDIDGIQYNLNKKQDSSFTITQDEQKVYDKIKNFTDDYNKIIEKINNYVSEKRQYSYQPLTDSQKEEMKDSEIEAWNKRAKQGILKHDNRLENLLSNLRSAFYTPVEGSSLRVGKWGTSAIGIDTSDSYSERGKILISDPDKLKEAIRENSEELSKLFCNSSSSSDEKTNYNETGIFRRMSNVLKENVGIPGTIINSAILTEYANKQDDYSSSGSSGSNTLPDQIYRKEKQVKEMLKQFSTKREQYYEKFSKLEVAMNQLNAQQSWLMEQLG